MLQQVRTIFHRSAEQLFLIEAVTDRHFTYGEFYERAYQVALTLHVHGIGRHGRVVMVLPNSVEFAACYFGCLFLGAVAVPVNPLLHQHDIAFALNHSNATLLLYAPSTHALVRDAMATTRLPSLCIIPQQEYEQATPEQLAHGWSFQHEPSPDRPDWEPFDGVQDDDLFSITFTSGTTSMPKGVAHRIGGLLGNADAFNQDLGFGPQNRFLHVLPMAYMAGFLNTLLSPFMAEASVVLARPFDPQSMLRFWQPVTAYHADTFWMAPTMLAALLRIDRDPSGATYCRNHVKTICVGTAPLSLRVRYDFEQKYGVTLFESYGLSELLILSGNSHRYPVLDGSVGRLLPGVEIHLVDEQGAAVAVGDDGEITIRTPYMMAGYLHYETLQPEPLAPSEWFPTGDIGHLDADGYLFITGRKKDLIIRGGINISPRAVEEVVLQHDAIEQVAVIGVPHDLYGEEVVAVVQLKTGAMLESIQPELVALCRAHLSVASQPGRFVALDTLPTSSTGKVQKARLRAMLTT